MKKNIFHNAAASTLLAATALLVSSCDDTIDNLLSRNKSVIEITPSAESIVLDESRPDDVALTVTWTPTYDYGNDYIINYQYQMELIGSTSDAISEYEDDGNFTRSYTNRELQEILTSTFGQLTSTPGNLLFTVTATIQGSRLVVPDIATTTVRVKTYGEKQFLANKLYMAGTAVGATDVELSRSESDTLVYSYNGALSAGTIYFPVTYYDESNAVGPSEADTPITENDMEAVVTDRSSANYWTIPESDTYRITVNLRNHTVKIVSAGSVVLMDKVFLAGTAVPGGGQIELEQTLEDENVYAFHAELNAGTLYLPLEKDGATDYSIVPKSASTHTFSDGVAESFGQVATATAESSRYWNIATAGTYRIVLDTDDKSITIYSPETDPQSKQVSWNNTVLGVNPYTSTVDTLYMYGTFNSYAHDTGWYTGYQSKYTLKQSLANPYIFVYSGDVLPRNTSNDDRGNAKQGSVRFTVSHIHNNVYAYGSSADAKRGDHNGYVEVTDNSAQKLVEGQGDNRYAYFLIPENCNFVVVDIKNLTVKFDTK